MPRASRAGQGGLDQRRVRLVGASGGPDHVAVPAGELDAAGLVDDRDDTAGPEVLDGACAARGPARFRLLEQPDQRGRSWAAVGKDGSQVDIGDEDPCSECVAGGVLERIQSAGWLRTARASGMEFFCRWCPSSCKTVNDLRPGLSELVTVSVGGTVLWT